MKSQIWVRTVRDNSPAGWWGKKDDVMLSGTETAGTRKFKLVMIINTMLLNRWFVVI
jgi:hypothetical protein